MRIFFFAALLVVFLQSCSGEKYGFKTNLKTYEITAGPTKIQRIEIHEVESDSLLNAFVRYQGNESLSVRFVNRSFKNAIDYSYKVEAIPATLSNREQNAMTRALEKKYPVVTHSSFNPTNCNQKFYAFPDTSIYPDDTPIMLADVFKPSRYYVITLVNQVEMDHSISIKYLVGFDAEEKIDYWAQEKMVSKRFGNITQGFLGEQFFPISRGRPRPCAG